MRKGKLGKTQKQGRWGKCIVGLGLLLTLSFYMGGQGSAAEELPEKQPQVLKVAVMDYSNYIQKNEDGSVSGYAYEYLQEIASHTGWEYAYIEMNFQDAMTALEKGEIDIVPGNQYTEERAAKMDFSKKDMGEGGSVLCVRPDDMKYCFNDYEEYDGIRIAGLAGSVRMAQAKEKLAEYGTTAQFVEFDTDEESKEALEQGKVDAILMSSIRCENSYKILARLNTAALYFCSNRNKPWIKEELDQAMEEIHLDSPYYEQELDKKYYGSVPLQLAYTQEEERYIESAGAITVAVSEDLAPIEYYSEEKECFCGVVPDTFALITEKTGLKFEFVSREDLEFTKRRIDKGDIQVLASVADMPGIAEKWNVNLTNAYRSNSVSVVINDTVANYKNTDCRVAMRKGYPYLEEMARKEGYEDLIYADDFDTCMKMVQNRTADMSFVPSDCADITIHKQGYDNLETYLMPDTDMNYSMGISKEANPLLLSVLNKALALITSDQQTELLVQNLNVASTVTSWKGFFVVHRVAILFGVLVIAAIIMLLMVNIAVSRKRTNLRLEAALKKADAASNAKTDFLSRMSHDIRTPMNAIIGLTHLAEEEKDSGIVQEYLHHIESSSDFLLGLINDILDMSKIESGALKLNPEPYLYATFEESINTVIKPLMDEKNINFQFENKGMKECILVDKLRFNQIFFNLLSNAAKFTPDGGTVAFIIEPLPSKEGTCAGRYTIRDNGVGMSAEFLPHIYESFSQEKTQETVNLRGTGLGLPIVKNLVDAMQGTIEVHSNVGVGTEFIVELCAERAEDGETASVNENGEYHLEHAEILLVEDNNMNILVARKLLEKVGCHVTVAKDGQEALSVFEQSAIGFFRGILMDVRMPVMDGLTATRRIRALQRSDAALVPIIAMTADAFEEERKKTIEAGMNYHLSKPINPSQLYRVLSDHVSNYGHVCKI